jgi:hypothetical protein
MKEIYRHGDSYAKKHMLRLLILYSFITMIQYRSKNWIL